MMDEYNPYAVSYDDTDPQTQIRTDLWNTMSAPDLVNQRDLLMTRMEKASRMFSHNTSPSVLNLYSAMQKALQDINNLIDNRSTQK